MHSPLLALHVLYITLPSVTQQRIILHVELGEGGGGVCVLGELIQTDRSSPDMITYFFFLLFFRQTKQNGILETHLWNPEKNFKCPN